MLHMVCDLTIAADNAVFGQTGPKVILSSIYHLLYIDSTVTVLINHILDLHNYLIKQA